jgi:uncharacterized protein
MVTPDAALTGALAQAISLPVVDWPAIHASLNQYGFARLPNLLSPAGCTALINQYDSPTLYRKTVDMARHRFGQGQYRYFSYPLPPVVQMLREVLYNGLEPLANAWAVQLSLPERYPASCADFLARCAATGAHLATPLILQYGQGGYNTLHQDLYGAIAFPFQLVVVLSEEGRDYTGGEFVLTEQRPRAQTSVQVLRLAQGEGLIFATSFRPVAGSRGHYRVSLRHGISKLHSGTRYALGVIVHDAVS